MPGSDPPPPPLLDSDAIEVDEQTRTDASFERKRAPTSPPPPPKPRRTQPPPPPPGPAAKQASPAALTAKAEIEIWRIEMEVLRRDAISMREKDPVRSSLLFGAASRIAAVIGDDLGSAAALEDAGELGQDRFVAMLSRREAMCARRWPEALELARKELPLVREPRERVALLVEIAGIEELARRDRASARKALEEAREIDPANTGVLEALAEIYASDSDWERLVTVLAGMADATVDTVQRSMMRHAVGLVHDLSIGSPIAARAAYKLALADDPSNLPAAVSLESLALAQEDWGELARILCVEAELIGEPLTIRRLCERAGDLYWERLGDADSAINAWRRAARATPEETAPLRKLSAVMESIGRWRELVEVYQLELPLLRDPEERADLHFRIGEVNEGYLGHVDEAIAAYRSALEVLPTHGPALQALGALYRAHEQYGELAQMDLREAEKIAEPLRRAERYIEVADLVEHRIGDPGEAARLYERAFDLAPKQWAAFEALDRLYRREERWADLVKLYERKSAAADDPALVRVLKQEAGRMWRERTPNADRAATAIKEAMKIDAPDLAPVFNLAQLLEAAERWDPLVEALGHLGAQLHEQTDLIATQQRLARIYEARLGQDDRALKVHEAVLAKEPGNDLSLRAIGRIHHRAGRWVEVIACYRRQLEHAGPAERSATWYRIGRIYERKLGQRDDAITSYEKALGEDPRYAPAYRGLERILRRDRMWPKLLETLARQAEAARTPVACAQAHHAMGQIMELHQRDLPGAERAYSAALRASPGYEAAVAALAHVSEARNDWPGLDRHYTELLQRTQENNARAAVLIRLGLLAELRLRDAERAARYYEDALDAGPLGRSAMQGELRSTRRKGGPAATVRSLARLGQRTSDARLQHGYRTLSALRDELSSERPSSAAYIDAASFAPGDPAVTDGVIRALSRESSREAADLRLPDALVERAQACGGAQAKSLLLVEAAFYFDRMRKVRDAALAYEDAGRAVPDFLPVLRGIRRIAAASGEWRPVAALLAREAEVAASPENRASAYLAAGEIMMDRIGDPRGALGHYRRLLEIDPHHEMAYLRGTVILERLEDHQGLFDLLGARVAATSDTESRAVLLRRQAELQRDHLRDPRGAVASLKQALVHNPADVEALNALAPLVEQQEWWQDAADCHRQIAQLTAGTDLARTARLREAHIRERELGDREAARSILEELVVDPDDREAAMHMAALCERMGNWIRARDLFAQLVKTARSPGERAGYLLSFAAVLDGGFGDREAAQGAIDEAFALALGDGEAVKVLEQRFSSVGDWRGFVAGGERACGRTRVVAAPQAALRLALARAYTDELSRPELAMRHLTAALELQPHDPLPALLYAQIHVSGDRAGQALPYLRRALQVDPLHAEALREIGHAIAREGVPDAEQLMADVASFVSTGQRAERSGDRPHGPRPIKRALSPEELGALAQRPQTSGSAALAELSAMLEPFSAALLVEATGRIPRGDELPEANGISLRCRAALASLNVERLRVFVDPPEGREVRLVADARLALCVGKALTQSGAEGRLAFETARQAFFIASRTTLAAIGSAADVAAILVAIVREEVPESLKELKRRMLKVIPRRARKDAERIAAEQLTDLNREVALWHAEEHRQADRCALLISRDPVAALQSAASDSPSLREHPRAMELLSWLTSDACWRAYLRLFSV